MCHGYRINKYERYYSDKHKKNCHSTKVTHKLDYYILHPVLLTIKSLLINTIICYYFAKKNPSKQKGIDALTI